MCQMDAFASKLFEGNPAAVCPFDKWLPDEIMQSIAAENNLSEAAFFIPKGNGFRIRWFTPVSEIVDDRFLISGKAIKHWKAELKSKHNKSVKGDVKKNSRTSCWSVMNRRNTNWI